jgi:hypothetical protein
MQNLVVNLKKLEKNLKSYLESRILMMEDY